jgi:hypothetical protein
MLHTAVNAAYICGCRILVDNAYHQVSCERDPVLFVLWPVRGAFLLSTLPGKIIL